MLNIEVVYALAEHQSVLAVQAPPGSTASEVLVLSGLLEQYCALSVQSPIGVYGEIVSPDTVLVEGDRLEIYRPLQIDPMSARRKRAAGN